MKKLVYAFTLFFSLLTIFSCTVEPKKIEYGKDVCHFCKMTIVDKVHASELVTKKGKAFKYDAIECLINYLETVEEGKVHFFLVTDYLIPKKLIDAKKATYLISKEIASPMGAYLSAFESQEKALKYAKVKNGITYSWNEIKEHLKSSNR